MMTVVIDHERFGMRTEFATLDEAQQAIRDCGPEFADVTLRLTGDRLVYVCDGPSGMCYVGSEMPSTVPPTGSQGGNLVRTPAGCSLLQDRVADAADEIEMRRDLDAFGGGRPYTYDHATGHVTWADGIQASVWRDADGTFQAADITPPAAATTDGAG